MTERNVESIHPLTPVQQALLTHALIRNQSDRGLMQVRVRLCGDLDREAMVRAWGAVGQRHQAMRASIHWEDLPNALQVVRRTADFPVTFLDEHGDLAEYLKQDRLESLDLQEAPVMRCVVQSRGESDHEMIWTCHHLLLDGWSASIVLREWMQLYHGDIAGRPVRLPAAVPFARYLAWLKKRDATSTETYWQKVFDGLTASSRIPALNLNTREVVLGRCECAFDACFPQALESFAQDHHITANVVCQVALAIGLQALEVGRDVVVGCVVSGRPTEIGDVDTLVGICSNTIPIRICLTEGISIGDLLQEVYHSQSESAPYQHVSFVDVHRWISRPVSEPLFEAVLVYENYPWRVIESNDPKVLRIESVSGDLTSSAPLTVVVRPGTSFEAWIQYDTGLISDRTVRVLLDYFSQTLSALIQKDSNAVIDSLLEPVMPMQQRGEVAEADLQADVRTGRRGNPRNPIELQLRGLWQKILARKSVSVFAGFFDLGGTSLGALQCLAEINTLFERSLTIPQFCEANTIAGLAQILAVAPGETRTSSLIPLQPHGDRPPLFLMHGEGGHLMPYRVMIEHLPIDLPVYGLQMATDDRGEVSHDTVEAMVQHYLAEIRLVQAAGPYRIAGYCFGGNLAWETACQLELEGEEVSFLGLIESAVLSAFQDASGMTHLYQRLAGLPRRAMMRIERYFCSARLALTRRSEDSSHRQVRTVHQAHPAVLKALNAYVPRRYQGPAHVFRCRHSLVNLHHERTLGWRYLTSEPLAVHDLPGSHSNVIMAPHAGALAVVLNNALSDQPPNSLPND